MRYRNLINYTNQYGTRTSIILSPETLSAVKRLAKKEGIKKERYLQRIDKKNTKFISNSLFIRDYVVKELLNIVHKEDLPE